MIGIKESLKYNLKKGRSFFADVYYRHIWNKKEKSAYLNTSSREAPVIVSLTSFPGRIHIVYKTIRTIFCQNLKPDIIELWLAQEQFPNREKDLPNEILDLQKYGLDICWCSDIRSFKKLVPALKKHKDAIIVTADDDVYYKKDWLEKLYAGYLNDKESIHCHKVTKFYLKNGDFHTISGGKEYYEYPSFLNKLVGVGGVLYPPKTFDNTIFEETIFMKEASTNDDIWFWLMAVKNGKKIHALPEGTPKPIDLIDSYTTEKLTDINDKGEKLFWKQFKNLCRVFPEIEKKLRDEAELFIDKMA